MWFCKKKEENTAITRAEACALAEKAKEIIIKNRRESLLKQIRRCAGYGNRDTYPEYYLEEDTEFLKSLGFTVEKLANPIIHRNKNAHAYPIPDKTHKISW